MEQHHPHITNAEAAELSRLLAGMKNPPPAHRQHSFTHENLTFLNKNLLRCDASSFGFERAREIIAKGLAYYDRMEYIVESMKNEEKNPHVIEWLRKHAGSRTPVRCRGRFNSMANSRASGSWGQPLGGTVIEGTTIRIAVSQPSAAVPGGSAPLFYDYVEA